MATKTTDDKNRKKDDEELKKAAAAKKAEEESAEDEDEEEDEEDEDEEDEEEADAAPAKPVDRKHRPRHEEYFEGDRTESPDQEDPAWWVPHAVLGALVLIGVLGFFGIFNKPLGFLAAKPAGGTNTVTTSTHSTPPSPGAQQQQPQQPMQAPQPPRETFGAKHLLVMYKGSRRAPPNIERTKEEAKARATEAVKKAKGGAKFEDLVKEYSDEPGAAQRGGDLGKFQKGSMVPEFQAGLEKIKVGEVSDIVETPFGYHVILRTQ